MNDNDLVQLLEDASPDELTLDQLTLLRERVGQSQRVRAAFREHLRFRQAMCEVHSGVAINVGNLLAQAVLLPATPTPISSLYGWGLSSGMALMVATAITFLSLGGHVPEANSSTPAPLVAAVAVLSRSDPLDPIDSTARRPAEPNLFVPLLPASLTSELALGFAEAARSTPVVVPRDAVSVATLAGSPEGDGAWQMTYSIERTPARPQLLAAGDGSAPAFVTETPRAASRTWRRPLCIVPDPIELIEAPTPSPSDLFPDPRGR